MLSFVLIMIIAAMGLFAGEPLMMAYAGVFAVARIAWELQEMNKK